MKSSKKKETPKNGDKKPRNGFNGKSGLVDCVRFFGAGIPLTGEGLYLPGAKPAPKKEKPLKDKEMVDELPDPYQEPRVMW